MSIAEAQTASPDPRVGKVDMNLEVHVIPVSDVDRAKQFYERLGWRLDDDAAPLDGLRSVQFTPPGSGTSVTFGTGLTAAAPGSAAAGLVVSDIEAAHASSSAGASTRATCGTARRSPPRPGNPASIPSAPATGRSSPSTIPTAMCGWSRRSRHGSPAGSTPPSASAFQHWLKGGRRWNSWLSSRSMFRRGRRSPRSRIARARRPLPRRSWRRTAISSGSGSRVGRPARRTRSACTAPKANGARRSPQGAAALRVDDRHRHRARPSSQRPGDRAGNRVSHE